MDFRQTAFLEPYIQYNTELQKQAEKGTIVKQQNAKLKNNDRLGRS